VVDAIEARDPVVTAHLERLIRDVPDFPKPGIVFKDIAPLLADHDGFSAVVRALAGAGSGEQGTVDKVVGPQDRGFIFGAPVALDHDGQGVPVRKAGKLPRETWSVSYDLEYGSETLEMHTNAIAPGDRVLVVDDVLATGGTAKATVGLVEAAGGVVHGIVVLLELSFLPGRAIVGDVPLTALRTV